MNALAVDLTERLRSVYEFSCGLMDMMGGAASQMVQIHASLDDVGTCGKDGMCCVAGYVAYKGAWDKFNWRWMMTLQQLNLPFLHTAKYLNEFPLVNRSGPLTDDDICVILAPFIEAVKGTLLQDGGFPICVITECDAYENLTPEQKKYIRPPEEHSFEMAVGLTCFCLQNALNLSDRVAVQMDEAVNAPRLYARYEALKRENDAMRGRLTALCFCDDQGHPPVQAADMLANVVLKTWKRVSENGEGSRPFRELTMNEGTPRMRLLHYDADRLSAFANKRMAARNRMDLLL